MKGITWTQRKTNEKVLGILQETRLTKRNRGPQGKNVWASFGKGGKAEEDLEETI